MEKSNGSLLVAGSIDREELSRYALTIKAEDSGGLASVAQVIIRVVDVNDKNPEFADSPYIFRVKENDLTGYIGRVHVNVYIFILNDWVVDNISVEMLISIDFRPRMPILTRTVK